MKFMIKYRWKDLIEKFWNLKDKIYTKKLFRDKIDNTIIGKYFSDFS
jgi:hypothetical protein